MAKNLRHGYNFIRLALTLGILVSLAGLGCAYHLISSAIFQSLPIGYAYGALAALALNTIALIAVFWMLAARNLAQRVKVFSAALNRGAEGDLSTRLTATGRDEFGMLNRNFNMMMERLAGVAGGVVEAIVELRRIATEIKDVAKDGVKAAELQSEGVSRASHAVFEINRSVNQVSEWVEGLSGSATENASSILELSGGIEEINQHVESLSHAVEEVSTSILQMTTAENAIGESAQGLMNDSATTLELVAELDVSIKQVGENALQTANISQTVREDAERGRQAVEETISGINEIRSSSRSTVSAIENLSARATDIGKILSVIDEVAEQTNLLALNASIIAAQAGEHGKGFAVVADEIKELARRTSSSTREIAGITRGVQEETQRVVSAIKLSEQRIAEGERLSQRSGEALQKIVSGVQQATTRVNEIAQTTEEQSLASENMRQAMERVANMVRQIARATREQGRGSEQIVSAVERMKELTVQVRITTMAQSEVSSNIVQATSDISSMIDNVRTACEEERNSSELIVDAMENIRESTHSSVQVTKVIDDAVAGLTRQVKHLQQKMAGFSL